MNLRKCDYFHIFIEITNNNIIASEIKNTENIYIYKIYPSWRNKKQIKFTELNLSSLFRTKFIIISSNFIQISKILIILTMFSLVKYFIKTISLC